MDEGTALSNTLTQSSIKSLPLIHQGKVRDIYDIDANTMLLIATDRLSAFDVILPTPIQGKGAILTEIANFWFEKLGHIVPNHLTGIDPDTVVSDATEKAQLGKRALVVKKLKPLPIEAIVRGYLAGSGWKEYKVSGTVCGISLPAGLQEASKLPQPIFTPSSKAAVGDHDENITLERCAALLGKELAEKVERVSLRLYQEAAEYALTKGIIIADTKFEFGLDVAGELYLILATTPICTHLGAKGTEKISRYCVFNKFMPFTYTLTFFFNVYFNFASNIPYPAFPELLLLHVELTLSK